MKIPKLQSAISALIPNAEVLSTIPPDEVISIGCTKQSAYITGSYMDDYAECVDFDITTLPEDVFVQYVDAANEPIADAKNELLFKKNAPVPCLHGITIAQSMKNPVKLAIQQGDVIDYIESVADKDLIEISARLHGGFRQQSDKSQNIEPASIHVHLN